MTIMCIITQFSGLVCLVSLFAIKSWIEISLVKVSLGQTPRRAPRGF